MQERGNDTYPEMSGFQIGSIQKVKTESKSVIVTLHQTQMQMRTWSHLSVGVSGEFQVATTTGNISRASLCNIGARNTPLIVQGEYLKEENNLTNR